MESEEEKVSGTFSPGERKCEQEQNACAGFLHGLKLWQMDRVKEALIPVRGEYGNVYVTIGQTQKVPDTFSSRALTFTPTGARRRTIEMAPRFARVRVGRGVRRRYLW